MKNLQMAKNSGGNNFEKEITVLCGGVGAAKFLQGLVQVVPEAKITAIINTGDDMEHCGMHISPDIDTVIYTLAGKINKKTGWGLENETWLAMEKLKYLEDNTPTPPQTQKYGWFNLGDRDLGTHLYRTARLQDGISLAQITSDIAKSYNIDVKILPMSNNPVRTRIILPGEEEISFQEYFVKLHHDVEIAGLRFEGADSATPAPGIMEALESCEKILIAPSNPLLSIAPILAIDEIALMVRHRRKDVAFISPIVGGKALKGPAAEVLSATGHIPDSAGVAKFYSDFADTAVIDTQDEQLAPVIHQQGQHCLTTNTIMSSLKKSAKLAEEILEFLTNLPQPQKR